MIQLWAVFGFIKLYHVSEPGREDAPQKKLSQRLRDSLFRRTARENDVVTGRLGRPDSYLVLLGGSLMVLFVLAGAYAGMSDEASVERALYVTLYLVAQIFCLGIIAFLSQLYAANDRYVMAGFFICLAIALTALLYTFARYGLLPLAFSGPTALGTDLYLHHHELLSPFVLRLRSMGWGGAIMPWLVMGPIAGTLACVLLHPARRKLIAGPGLILMALLGLYDLFGARGHFHFLIILPAWTAVTLAWGRSGYGPLWAFPASGEARKRAARALAALR